MVNFLAEKMIVSIFRRPTIIQNFRCAIVSQCYSQQSSNQRSSGSGGGVSVSINNVTGLTRNCVDVPNNPVGPKASKNGEYKNPEYFCYNTNSFAEAEVEMAKFRLPAPSNKKKV